MGQTMIDNERIQAVREAWVHDMTYPFSAWLNSEGTAFEATYVDSHTEMRNREEARERPFRVGVPKSDVADIGFLLQQLEQRDKTIAELGEDIKTDFGIMGDLEKALRETQQENTLMLSALEWVHEKHGYTRISNVLDEVKALTVSKQGVSTDSEDDCEQTVEESKNPSLVARPNKPNQPTEHNHQLAQHVLAKEVAADKLWRGETI